MMNKYIIIIFFFVSHLYGQKQNVYNLNKVTNEYIYGDTLVKLYAGDKIYIHLNKFNKENIHFKLKKEEKDTLNLIIISLSIENISIDKGMMLKIYNPYNTRFNYRAKIGPTKFGEYIETSVIPVKSKLTSIETWPYVFNSIILYDFKLE